MAQLTTTSKVIIISFVVLLFGAFGFGCYACMQGCNRSNQGYYQSQPQGYQQPYYPPQPPYQTVVLQDGSSVMMDYLLWTSLMNQGGPTVVNNYYRDHRNDPEFQSDNQQRFQQTQKSYEEKVQTQKSNGFGSRPVETNKSNGFGSKPVETQKSKGFGSSWSSPSTYSSPSTSTVTTTRSNGFGSSSSSSSSSFKSTPSISTKPSSGFGSKTNSVSTSKSSGFGKKN